MSDIRLTPEQTAGRLGISKYAVYDLCKGGELGHFRFGRKIVIPEDEVVAYEQRSFQPAVVSIADRRADLRAV